MLFLNKTKANLYRNYRNTNDLHKNDLNKKYQNKTVIQDKLGMLFNTNNINKHKSVYIQIIK